MFGGASDPPLLPRRTCSQALCTSSKSWRHLGEQFRPIVFRWETISCDVLFCCDLPFWELSLEII